MIYSKVLFLLALVLYVRDAVAITKSQFNIAGRGIQDLIDKDLKSLIRIPDQSFRRGKVYDIKVLDLTLPDVSVSLKNSKLTIMIRNFAVKLTANWNAKYLWWKPRGSLKVDASGISITLRLNIETLQVLNCEDPIKKIDTSFKGNNLSGRILSWITRIFRRTVNKRLKSKLKGKLCSELRSLIHKNRKKIAEWLGITFKPIPTATPRPFDPCAHDPRLGPFIKPPKNPECVEFLKNKNKP